MFYLGVNTLQRHLLVDRLLWAWDAVTVSLAVLVVVGVILGLSHGDRFNELKRNYDFRFKFFSLRKITGQ